MRKRSIRRRRQPLRRRRMGRRYRAPKPDGAICSKIHATYDMLNDAANNYASININWAGNGLAPLGTDTARVTVQPEFTHMVADYNEYRVKGFKFQIVPMQSVSTAADTGFYYIEMATDTRVMIADTVADSVTRGLTDYKMVPGARTLTRYISCGKYFSKRNVKWLLTSDNYPDVGTLVRLKTTGFAGNAVLAKCFVTWYVEFKGLQL